MHPWLHFKTITKHKLLVMKYCFRIGLYKQGLLHDLSKYTPAEFLVGCKYYQGTRSPNNAEREDIGVSTSWLHHKGRNKHHFEHWVDYSLDGEHVIMGAQMPRKYVAEMVMDRHQLHPGITLEMPMTTASRWIIFSRAKKNSGSSTHRQRRNWRRFFAF